MKTFVTGLTGSGKTTLAKTLADRTKATYVNYDDEYGYSNVTPEHCRKFIDGLPSNCVVDAVPFDPTWETFNVMWEGGGEFSVYCTVLKQHRWLQRTPASRHKLTPELWNEFWLEVFPTARFPVTYIDTDSGVDHYDEISHGKAMYIIDMYSRIWLHINTAEKPYDARYQNITEIGLEGYSGSRETWVNIKGLADWESASVVDCGTFHGYMLFRIRDTGCQGPLLGLDFMEAPLVAARAVNKLRNDTVRFRQWNAGELLPYADVTLCLNALHHFEKPEFSSISCPVGKFFDTIQSPVTIFEVGILFLAPIERHWRKVETFPSSRPGRAIYRCYR